MVAASIPKTPTPLVPKPTPHAAVRRDGSGHLDPAFEADLLARVRANHEHSEAEHPEPVIPGLGGDAAAKAAGALVVETATSGEDTSLDGEDPPAPEALHTVPR